MDMLITTITLIAAIASDQAFDLNEKQVLPTYGAVTQPDEPLDHATIAINDVGDVFVVWQGEDTTHNRFFVEGLLIPRTGPTTDEWTIPAAMDDDFHILFGDHLLDELATDGDSCKKPDVVAVGSNFIVVWSRINVQSSTGQGRLESAFVEVTSGAISSINGAAPSNYAGVGDIADSSVSEGLPGLMPDLVALATDVAGVVYVHQAWTDGTDYREFDLRFANLDYSSGTLNTNLLNHQTLVEDQPLDNIDSPNGTPMVGGNVAPDVVLDASGNIVVAYSTFVSDHGTSIPQEGNIWLYRFEWDSNASEWVEMEHTSFDHSNGDDDPTRRPNLATSVLDFANGDDVVLLTWIDTTGTTGTTPYKVRVMEVDYSSGSPVVNPNYDTHTANGEDSQCVPLNLLDADGNDSIFFDKETTSPLERVIRRRLLSLSTTTGSTAVVTTAYQDENWRPALATLESVGSFDDLVAISWEGNDSDPYEIHVVITKM